MKIHRHDEPERRDDVVITPHPTKADRDDEQRSKGDAGPPPPFWSRRVFSLVLIALVAAAIALVTVLGVVVSSRNDIRPAAADVLGRDDQPGVTSTSSTTAATISSNAQIDEGGLESTTATTGTPSDAGDDGNPGNFFCGGSFAHAAEMCEPCPSGDNNECPRWYRCIGGVTGCKLTLAPTSTAEQEYLSSAGAPGIHSVICRPRAGCIISSVPQCRIGSVDIVSGPSKGVLEGPNWGPRHLSFHYRPDFDATASAVEFVYKVCCEYSSHCDTATVHVQISNVWSEGEPWQTWLERCWSESGPCGNPVAVYKDSAVIVTEVDEVGAVLFFSYVDGRFELVRAIPYPHEHLPLHGLIVAMSEDVVALGVPGESLGLGAVYMFEQDASGNWTQADSIYPDTGHSCSEQTPSNFGASVDIDGGVMIVGSRIYDERGDLQRGPAYIYRRTVGSWVEQAELPTCFGDNCGVSWSGNPLSVSIRGNFALIAIEGSLFAYEFDAVTTKWTQREIRLTNGDALTGDGNDIHGCDRLEEVFVFEDSAFLIKCTGSNNSLRFYVTADNGMYRFAQEVANYDSADSALAVEENILALENDAVIHILTRESNAWLEVGTIDIPPEDYSQEDCDNEGGVHQLSISGDKLLVSLRTELVSSRTGVHFHSLSSLGVQAKSAAAPPAESVLVHEEGPGQTSHSSVKFEGALFETDCGPPFGACGMCTEGCVTGGVCHHNVKTSNSTILVSRRIIFPHCWGGVGHTLAPFPNTNVNVSLWEWRPEPSPSDDADTIDIIPIIPRSQLPRCVQTRSASAFALAGDGRILVACEQGDVYYYSVSEVDGTAVLLQTFTVMGDPEGKWGVYSIQIAVEGDIMALSFQRNWHQRDYQTETSDVYVFSRTDDTWEMISQVCPPGAKDKFGFGNELLVMGNKVVVTSQINAYLYSIEPSSHKKRTRR